MRTRITPPQYRAFTGNSVNMLKEFKEFIARGNVVDMAVGIIIGAAFTAIVTSMVDDLINPIIGLLTGGIDFSNKYLVMSGEVPAGASLAAARDSGAAIFAYGSFLMAVLNFLIVAFVVFMLVKAVNRAREVAAPTPVVVEPPAGPTQEELLAQIRDILAAGSAPAQTY